jgi:hypothetical protein
MNLSIIQIVFKNFMYIERQQLRQVNNTIMMKSYFANSKLYINI